MAEQVFGKEEWERVRDLNVAMCMALGISPDNITRLELVLSVDAWPTVTTTHLLPNGTVEDVCKVLNRLHPQSQHFDVEPTPDPGEFADEEQGSGA